MRRKKVVITFDDGFAAQYHIAAPILKKYKHNATFFVCGAFIEHRKIGHLFMNWDHVAQLDADGFEIGNHLYHHAPMTDTNIKHQANINKLDNILKGLNIPKPVSLSYPGFHVDARAIKEVRAAGYQYARAGCERTNDFTSFQTGGSAPHYNYLYDNPYNINCSGMFGSNFDYENFVKTLEKVDEDEIPVYCFHSFHGLDLPDAPATSISIESFENCMKYLRQNNFQGIAMRDI